MGGPGSGRRKAAVTIEREIEDAKATAGSTPGEMTIGEEIVVELREVRQPSGSKLNVQGPAEQAYYEAARDKYVADFKFEDAAEVADLDSLLMHELMHFRYAAQLASGKDYSGLLLQYRAEDQARQNLLAEAKIIGELKRQMGITRAAKDAQQGSVSVYISDLLKRAKAFGVYRQDQATRAITLAQELKSIVSSFDRMNDVEKRTIGIEDEADIVAWVRETFIPGFDEIDAKFSVEQAEWMGTL